MSSQQKAYQCRNGCGTEIYFDNNRKSESGKAIPLEKETGNPHNCPNSSYNKNKPGGGQGGVSPEKIAEIMAKLEQHEKRITELEMKKWQT